ncbi:hypothetical protein PMAC_003322 [Pneumocystis sp. 'macacae']|nr:hypothetical protein PMAC_003322 [Pneumocystis sp. 'macacae']
MPKILNLRKIQKKKNKGTLHPRSRKAKQIQRSVDRDIRLKKAQKKREKERDMKIARYIYFKSYVELENIEKLNQDELSSVVEKFFPFFNKLSHINKNRYIHRNETKIHENSSSNVHQHFSSKKIALKHLLDNEQNEYESGFCVPDLTDPQNVLALKNWSGNYNDLHILKFIYVQKKLFNIALASKELSTKLGSEIKHEMSLMKEEIPENIKTFIEDGVFEIIDHQNSNEVELVRKFKDEKISITFSVSDINNMESDDFYTHENENEQMQKETLKTKEASEFEQENTPFSFLVRCNIAIAKPGSGALVIDAVAQDGAFIIDNILYYKDENLALAQTAEADWQRRGTYIGPSFHSLDEDIQAMFEHYLEERAINTSLALFIPEYVNYKEQKEYVNWLQV